MNATLLNDDTRPRTPATPPPQPPRRDDTSGLHTQSDGYRGRVMFRTACPAPARPSAQLPGTGHHPDIPAARTLAPTLGAALLCGALLTGCGDAAPTTDDATTSATAPATSASTSATGLPTDPALDTATPTATETSEPPAAASPLTDLRCDSPRLTTAMSILADGLPPQPDLSSSRNGALTCIWGEEDNQVEVRVTVSTTPATAQTVAAEVAEDPELRRIIDDPRFTTDDVPGFVAYSEENPDGAIEVRAYLPAADQTHRVQILAGGTTAMTGLPENEMLDATWRLLTAD